MSRTETCKACIQPTVACRATTVRSAITEHLTVIAVMIVCTIINIRPYWNITAGTPGDIDGWMNMFHLWWMRQAFELQLNPFVTPFLHHPTGAELYWHTLIPAKTVWAIPLLPIMDIVSLYNLLILSSFVLTGYTSWLLYRHITQSIFGASFATNVAACIAAYYFTFSPYRLGHAVAHINLLSLEGIPIFLLGYLMYAKNGSKKWLILCGVSALYVILCDYYSFAYILLFIAIDVARIGVCQGSILSRRFITSTEVVRAAHVMLSAIVFASPLIVMLIVHLFPRPLNFIHGDSDFYLDLLGPLVPYPGSLFRLYTPATLRRVVLTTVKGGFNEGGFFLGWSALIFVFYGIRKNIVDVRKYAAIGASFFVLALGTHLSIAGSTHLRVFALCLTAAALLCLLHFLRLRRLSYPLLGFLLFLSIFDAIVPFTLNSKVVTVQVPLPYILLKNLLPLYGMGGMPVRFIMMVYLTFGACIALTISSIAKHAKTMLSSREILLVCIVFMIAEFSGADFKVVPQGPMPGVMHQIRAEPPEIAIMTDDHIFSELEILYHEHPISGGRLSRVPVHQAEEQNKLAFRVLLGGLDPETLTPAQIQEIIQYIRSNHFKYLIRHNSLSTKLRTFITSELGGKVLAESNIFYAYQLYY